MRFSSPYCLPPLNQTWVVYVGDNTVLLWRENNAVFSISACRGILDHEAAYRRHVDIVRRFRRIQRLWRFGGKYLPFVRTALLRAIEV
jgi:hypothetical protein